MLKGVLLSNVYCFFFPQWFQMFDGTSTPTTRLRQMVHINHETWGNLPSVLTRLDLVFRRSRRSGDVTGIVTDARLFWGEVGGRSGRGFNWRPCGHSGSVAVCRARASGAATRVLMM